MGNDTENLRANRLVYVDAETGLPSTISFDQLLEQVGREAPIDGSIPAAVRAHLDVARKYLALSLAQGMEGRLDLLTALGNDAVFKGVIALELSLRDRLNEPKTTRLARLIDLGTQRGILLDNGPFSKWLWKWLKDNRNRIAHGDGDVETYGTSATRVFRVIVAAINAIYDEPASTTPSAPAT